jgi:hypothetical protein
MGRPVSGIDKPAKKRNFADAAVLRIHARKFVPSVVEGNNIELAFPGRRELLIQVMVTRSAPRFPAPFLRARSTKIRRMS